MDDVVQEQSDSTINHHNAPLLLDPGALLNNEAAPFQAVPKYSTQEHTALSTAFDPLVNMTTGPDAASPSFLSPHPDLSLARARRPRRARNNNRRKEKVECGMDGCCRVLSRDSLRRHWKEFHMGLKRRGKGKADRGERGV